MRLTTPEGELPSGPPTRRGALASLFTAGYALALAPPASSAIETDTDGLVIEEPVFKGAGEYGLPGYLARPAKARRAPAVLVVNEIFGIHAYIKDVCRRLAKAGYVALAPDYFDRAGDPAVLTDFAAIRPIVAATLHEQVMRDTEGAVAYLRGRRDVAARKMAITGFCWGGAVTWMACARSPLFRAGVAWYGRLVPPPADGFGAEPGRPWPTDAAGALKAPVLGLYAENDRGIPLGDVEAMRRALKDKGDTTGSEIVVYPGTEHGFHADYRPAYNEAAAVDGWARMLAWFKRHGAA
jgi:carboxymethylenebutenolidase